MKITQYTRQERAIAAADSSGIRERWLWGLRLLADQEKIAKDGGLKHGVTEQLIAAAAKRGIKLSASEIRYRLQCARTYPAESQIAKAIGDFETWFGLIQAKFPAVKVPADEPPADWRTKDEQDEDRARALIDLVGEQGTLFNLRDFEPVETTLGDLEEYTKKQEKLTANFVAHDHKRRAYLEAMISAVNGDLGKTWAEGHAAAFSAGDDPTIGS